MDLDCKSTTWWKKKSPKKRIFHRLIYPLLIRRGHDDVGVSGHGVGIKFRHTINIGETVECCKKNSITVWNSEKILLSTCQVYSASVNSHWTRRVSYAWRGGGKFIHELTLWLEFFPYFLCVQFFIHLLNGSSSPLATELSRRSSSSSSMSHMLLISIWCSCRSLSTDRTIDGLAAHRKAELYPIWWWHM